MKKVFDSAWRQSAIAGDAVAVKTLAETALAPLYRFCFQRVGCNHHLCEEVVQETLVTAIHQLPRYEPDRAGNNIMSWLTGLARNEIRRVLAREQAAVSLELLWDKLDNELRPMFARLEAEPFGDELLCREETRELVNATMAQLPAHYRDALEAKYVLKKSVRDIAVATSSPP